MRCDTVYSDFDPMVFVPTCSLPYERQTRCEKFLESYKFVCLLLKLLLAHHRDGMNGYTRCDNYRRATQYHRHPFHCCGGCKMGAFVNF